MAPLGPKATAALAYMDALEVLAAMTKEARRAADVLDRLRNEADQVGPAGIESAAETSARIERAQQESDRLQDARSSAYRAAQRAHEELLAVTGTKELMR